MAIRLDTSKRRGIDNHQDSEITEPYRRWFRTLPNLHPNAVPRTQPSPLFNCHGLTFASRRTKIVDWKNIQKVLADDAWIEIPLKQTLPGDIVIYFDDEGDANHSGIVVEGLGGNVIPKICSKWGNAGEFLHWLSDVPSFYGPVHRFYRCRL
jgi:hypothetical protein